MSQKTSILPSQCRAARAFIGWSRAELAKRARVSEAMLADFEAGKRTPYERTLSDVIAVLEGAGVAFLREPGRVGVTVAEERLTAKVA